MTVPTSLRVAFAGREPCWERRERMVRRQHMEYCRAGELNEIARARLAAASIAQASGARLKPTIGAKLEAALCSKPQSSMSFSQTF
jgi:hypothetical protein